MKFAYSSWFEIFRCRNLIFIVVFLPHRLYDLGRIAILISDAVAIRALNIFDNGFDRRLRHDREA